ncbi:unnamed protein product [Vitrella brassicaformis CCMP3155]|uniref:SAP domain-containing protein n=4 Tax=Vitrella brassicaformis TaxID=1169539 RepID=A0A0G4FCG3_VITBC|nr:unnamed protein product [Vitrella brassicaformis CCMP3155]|eukprot:CEM10847.1 unnamed protein product [Vitrella brassicaformis CCMP3155]
MWRWRRTALVNLISLAVFAIFARVADAHRLLLRRSGFTGSPVLPGPLSPSSLSVPASVSVRHRQPASRRVRVRVGSASSILPRLEEEHAAMLDRRRRDKREFRQRQRDALLETITPEDRERLLTDPVDRAMSDYEPEVDDVSPDERRAFERERRRLEKYFEMERNHTKWEQVRLDRRWGRRGEEILESKYGWRRKSKSKRDRSAPREARPQTYLQAVMSQFKKGSDFNRIDVQALEDAKKSELLEMEAWDRWQELRQKRRKEMGLSSAQWERRFAALSDVLARESGLERIKGNVPNMLQDTNTTFWMRAHSVEGVDPAAYPHLVDYSDHFSSLLEEEVLVKDEMAVERLRNWTNARLESEGILIRGLEAKHTHRILKEKIVRLQLPIETVRRNSTDAGGDKDGDVDGEEGDGQQVESRLVYRRPYLPFHQFSRGDAVTLTLGEQNPLDAMDRYEGVVHEKHPKYIDIAVMDLPPELWKKNRIPNKQQQQQDPDDQDPAERKLFRPADADTADTVEEDELGQDDDTQGQEDIDDNNNNNNRTVSWRLDMFENRVSHDRMITALAELTAPNVSDKMAPDLRDALVYSFIQTVIKHKMGVGEDASTDFYAVFRRGDDPAPWNEWFSQPANRWWYSAERLDAILDMAKRQGLVDQSQEEAVRRSLTQRVTLIQGPPGTGKTRTSCLLLGSIVALMKAARAQGIQPCGDLPAALSATGPPPRIEKVLAAAFSNVAADNLLEGLIKMGVKAVRSGRALVVNPALKNYTVDAMVDQHPEYRAALAHEREARQRRQQLYRAHQDDTSDEDKAASQAKLDEANRLLRLAEEDVKVAEQRAIYDIVTKADVVVTSAISAGQPGLTSTTQVPEWDTQRVPVKFSTVLIDEASQVTEPAASVPMVKGCEQLILVGDQNQLPATVVSDKAKAEGLNLSLFSRLVLAGVVPVMLAAQYRMHPAIAMFPSFEFYDDRLISIPKPEERPTPGGFPWPDDVKPVAFVSVMEPAGYSESRPDETTKWGGSTTSKYNREEALCLVKVLKELVSHGDVSYTDIGVVTPYAAQVRFLQDTLRTELGRDTAALIEVKSVDGYQGREKEVILFSAVRSNPTGSVGFLRDWRRLNVAVTRARRGLVVFGDPRTLTADPHYDSYIQWCKHEGLVVDWRTFRPITNLDEAIHYAELSGNIGASKLGVGRIDAGRGGFQAKLQWELGGGGEGERDDSSPFGSDTDISALQTGRSSGPVVNGWEPHPPAPSSDDTQYEVRGAEKEDDSEEPRYVDPAPFGGSTDSPFPASLEDEMGFSAPFSRRGATTDGQARFFIDEEDLEGDSGAVREADLAELRHWLDSSAPDTADNKPIFAPTPLTDDNDDPSPPSLPTLPSPLLPASPLSTHKSRFLSRARSALRMSHQRQQTQEAPPPPAPPATDDEGAYDSGGEGGMYGGDDDDVGLAIEVLDSLPALSDPELDAYLSDFDMPTEGGRAARQELLREVLINLIRERMGSTDSADSFSVAGPSSAGEGDSMSDMERKEFLGFLMTQDDDTGGMAYDGYGGGVRGQTTMRDLVEMVEHEIVDIDEVDEGEGEGEGDEGGGVVELTAEMISGMRVNELKECCREMGLRLSGKKADLQERLLQHIQQQQQQLT